MPQTYKTLEYQEQAIQELLQKSKALLLLNKNIPLQYRTQLRLQAFTGAGKTYMMSRYVKEMADQPEFLNKKILFLFMTPGKGSLKEQSYHKFQSVINASLKLINDDELTSSTLEESTVLFTNWEQSKIGNLYKDNETASIFDIIAESKFDKTVLIIDEEHYAKNSDESQVVIEKFSPDLILNASATPQNEYYIDQNGVKTPRFNAQNTVKVNIADIDEAGVIKHKVFVNPDIDNLNTDTILQAALNKQDEIIAEEKRLNLTQLKDPLILVQVQNDSKVNNEKVEKGGNIQRIKDRLVALGLDENLIGIYASGAQNQVYQGETLYLKNVNDSDMKVLIFKQGIDLGVDIPRAHILVRLRDIKSASFDIQVTGRIMRTQEKEHYGNDIIDNAYIYNQYETSATNWKNLDFLIENGTIVMNEKSTLAELKDTSTFPDSEKAEKYLTLLKKGLPTNKLYTHNKIDDFDYNQAVLSLSKAISQVIHDTDVTQLDFTKDAYNGKMDQGSGRIDELAQHLSQKDVQSNDKLYVKTLYQNIFSHYTNKLNNTISKRMLVFMKKNFGPLLKEAINKDINFVYFVVNNKEFVQAIIFLFDFEYRQATSQQRQSIIDSHWTIPEKVTYIVKENKNSLNKYIYTNSPDLSVSATNSNSEEKFEHTMENSDNVLFWFKQKESLPSSFSIAYKKINDDMQYGANFYPDFMFVTKEGKLVIADTKSPVGTSDGYSQDTSSKLKAINKYLEKYKQQIIDLGFSDFEFVLLKYNDNNELRQVPLDKKYQKNGQNTTPYHI